MGVIFVTRTKWITSLSSGARLNGIRSNSGEFGLAARPASGSSASLFLPMNQFSTAPVTVFFPLLSMLRIGLSSSAALRDGQITLKIL